MKIAVTAPLTPEVKQALEAAGEVVYGGWGYSGQKLAPDELAQFAQDAAVLIVGYESVDESVLRQCPELQLVGCTRGGVGASVDVEAATRAGIPVIYTPGRNATAVADVVFGLLLAECRKIALASHLIRDRRWDRVKWDVNGETPFKRFSGPELAGTQMGLIGFGHIGAKVARRAQGFEMKVAAFDPYVLEIDLEDADVEPLSLEELLRTSDFISVHCRLTPETKGLLGARAFELMKSTAYLINTARGAIIDEKALYDALKEGQLAGAGLDVLCEEPPAPDDPLLELDNVTITPHLGGASDDIIRHQSTMILDDVRRVLASRRPDYLANPEVWGGAR